MSKLSIITINYNGLKDTLELIDSLYKYLTNIDFEILVVDNASSCSDELSIIKQSYPDIIPIQSTSNLGFAGGNNLGINVAKGEYILLLNNDTLLNDDSIKFLIESLDQNQEIGAISPKIKFSYSPHTIQYAGFTPLSKIGLRNKVIGYGKYDNGRFDQPNFTPYAHGAAMMVRRSVVDKVGKMPEIYFLYYEELDWCRQIRKAGYLIGYEPKCTVLHKESMTTGKGSAFKAYYITRNRLLYAQRNRKGIIRQLSLIYQICVVNLFRIIKDLLLLRGDYAKSRINGIKDFYKLRK